MNNFKLYVIFLTKEEKENQCVYTAEEENELNLERDSEIISITNSEAAKISDIIKKEQYDKLEEYLKHVVDIDNNVYSYNINDIVGVMIRE